MHQRFLAVLRILALALLVTLSATAQTQDPVGDWNLQSDAQGQVTNFVLTITKTADGFKGKVSSEQYGPQELTDLKVQNGIVTYTRKLEIGGQAVAMAFTGRIDGDKMTGSYNLQGFEIPVTGGRKKAAGSSENK